MGKALFYVWFVLLLWLRVVALAIFFASEVWTWRVIGALELVALACAIASICVPGKWDVGVGASWVPVAYAGIGIAPLLGQAPNSLVLLTAVVLSAACLPYLLQRFTIGCSVWHSLVDRGPYGWVRHPQLTARLVLLSSCGVVPCLVGIVCVGLLIAQEESFLEGFAEYREYQERVRSVLVPGDYVLAPSFWRAKLGFRVS